MLQVLRSPASAGDNDNLFSELSPGPSSSPLFSCHWPGWSCGGLEVRERVQPALGSLRASPTLRDRKLLPSVSGHVLSVHPLRSRRRRTSAPAHCLRSTSSIFCHCCLSGQHGQTDRQMGLWWPPVGGAGGREGRGLHSAWNRRLKAPKVLPWLVWLAGQTLSWAPKGCWFDSWSEHMPGGGLDPQ